MGHAALPRPQRGATVKLPRIGDQLVSEAFRTIELQDAKTEKTDRNIVIGAGRALILTSPNGTQFRVVVDNSGNIAVTDILDPDADNAFSAAFSSAFKVS